LDIKLGELQSQVNVDVKGGGTFLSAGCSFILLRADLWGRSFFGMFTMKIKKKCPLASLIKEL
jgi:hypothetical protein